MVAKRQVVSLRPRRQRTARGYHPPKPTDAAQRLLRALDPNHPFDMTWTQHNELASAFAKALHGPNTSQPGITPSAKLDVSQVEDLRTGRKVKPRRINATQQNAPTTPKATLRLKKLAKSGAFSGDGRVERPAPRYGASSRDDYAAGRQAGAAPSQPVQKPKPKPKPITNQGRHDG